MYTRFIEFYRFDLSGDSIHTLNYIEVKKFKKLEDKKLSENINYDEIKGLRIEARQKLNKVKPLSIGQASRISGVSPADVSVLLIYLEQRNKL